MTARKNILEQMLKMDAAAVNRDIIRKRVRLSKLLEHPFFEHDDKRVELDKGVLAAVAGKLSSPPDAVLLPVTIYVPAGSVEGYINDHREAATAAELGAGGMLREGKYWIQKYRAQSLCRAYPRIVQILYTA